MSVSVKVLRRDALARKLKRLAPEAQRALAEANRLSAEEMAALARRFAEGSRQSGDLIESIAATPPGEIPPAYSQGRPFAETGAHLVTVGNAKVRYAHLVEFGAKPHVAGGRFAGAEHPGAPAQPFFYPAFRIVRKKHRSRASRALNKAIKAIAGGGT